MAQIAASVPTDGYATVLSPQPETPLALKMLKQGSQVHDQQQSPLFGALPKELRDEVFKYSLTAYEDPQKLYPKHLRCCRPGMGGPLRVAKELLFTCRAVYLETYDLPATLNPLFLHCGDNRDLPPGSKAGWAKLNELSVRQYADVGWLDLSIRQADLEGTVLREYALHLQAGRRFVEGVVTSHKPSKDPAFLERVRRLKLLRDLRRGFSWRQVGNSHIGGDEFGQKEMMPKFPARPITRLTVRLGRTDWWTWTDAPNAFAKLALEPWRGTRYAHQRPNTEQMLQDAQARRDGTWEAPRWKETVWGEQLCHYPDLKTFELVMETFWSKRTQLDTVVQCAKTWTFPLIDDFELRWDGKVETSSWEGCSPKEYGYHHETPWLYTVADAPPTTPASPVVVSASPTLVPLPEANKFEVRVVRWVRRKKVSVAEAT